MQKRPKVLATVIGLALAPVALAGEIQEIDLTNFGPFDASGPMRVIYDRDVSGGVAGAITYGEIGWDELKAVDPGIIVYNNVPIYGASQIIADCVMAPRLASLAGDPDRKCNDGFQTHKRYKMSATGVGSIDMVFTVRNVDAVDPIVDKDGNPVANDQDAAVNVYRMIGKLNNHTGGRLGGFRVELGHGLGDDFVKSTAGDGVKIALREEGADPADDLGDNQMAEFPGGLFYGPADARHDWGFFSSTRANFAVDTARLAVDEDSFESTILSSNYSDLFGEWLPLDWVPTGWFYDSDGNPATDAEVAAWYDGTQWLSYDIDAGTGGRTTEVVPQTDIDGWEATPPTIYDDDGDSATTAAGTLYATWNAETELYELAAGGTATNDAMTTTLDGSATLERRPGYQQGPIEDLANLNLNYYIEIGDITTWPGYDLGTEEASFTLRITPLEPASTEPPAWLPVEDADAGDDNGGNGGCVMGDGRSGFDPLLPGMALLGMGYLALRRRRA
ncbi:hypothetical protein TspCOW1_21800 [Thiohalobacter sp. COW1]|uniref:choice-of-anchor F family protein n=1 Tax=Thiohalobacter sp. COW1 TaxID=2795687 RepID=UPI001915CCC4|nr:choice-of-anchor F family protein [Thiohalobacter sp. COW1]BCO32077.1 hypothetical protein TspCOW1_21800 [Thiohalobacter sp. COW1]